VLVLATLVWLVVLPDAPGCAPASGSVARLDDAGPPGRWSPHPPWPRHRPRSL